MLSQALPRRRLLRLFAKTGVMLTVAPFVAGHISACSDSKLAGGGGIKVHATTHGKLLMLDGSRSKILFAFAEVCLPNSNNEIHQANLVQRLDEELFYVSNSISDDFLLALDVLEYLPIVYGHFSRFSQMLVSERESLLKSLQQTRISSVRAVINACRMAVMLIFYGHDSTWASINYDGTFSHIPQMHSAQRVRYRKLTQAPGSES